MRQELTQYVNLLFAGSTGTEEIRQEILQNTLDRYDDLISQGKSPEAAYRLAISGIGDVNELFESQEDAPPVFYSPAAPAPEDPTLNRILRAIAIGLYIISIIPLIVLDQIGLSEIGLCGTLVLVAAATVILVLCRKPGSKEGSAPKAPKAVTPKDELKQSIQKLVSAIGLAVYLIISFLSGAWYITWLVFPITAAFQGLINACIDLLREENAL